MDMQILFRSYAKRLSFAAVALMLSLSSMGQGGASGVMLNSGRIIPSREMSLPGMVSNYAVDTLRKVLFVQLHYPKPGEGFYRQGSLMAIDIVTNSVKWTANIGEAAVMMRDSCIILLNANNSVRLDANTGAPLWSALNGFVYVDLPKGIGCGYSKSNPNLLVGVKMSSGQQIWSRVLAPEVGWKRVFSLNDSTILLNTTGLHSVNLYNGSGWDYDGSSVDSTQQTRVAQNLYVLGISTAYWDNPNVLAYYNPDWSIWDIQSNVVTKEDKLFYADKNNLVCLNSAGSVVWREQLPFQYRSKSSIFIKGDTLFMVNKGFAYQGLNPSTTISYGDFFLSAFDLSVGRQFYFSTPPKSSPQVADFRVKGNLAYILFKNQVSIYALASGVEMDSDTYKRSRTGDFLQFLPAAGVFENANDNYLPVSASDNYINSAVGSYMLSPEYDGSVGFLYAPLALQVVDLGSSLNFNGVWPESSFYWKSLEIGGLKFYTNGVNTVVQNSSGEFVAKLLVGSNVFAIGDMLYALSNGSFVSISLELLKN